MNDLVLPFEQINYKNVSTAGGKGASLGEMTQAGIPVPPGFVILTPSFEKFIQENGFEAKIKELVASYNEHDSDSITKASETIRELISKGMIPQEIQDAINEDFKTLDAEFVAVRSSATAEDTSGASWAGELETYLNTQKPDVLETVKKCWSSLFTPRAMFYRIEKGFKDIKVSVAVVVQKMVQSEVSGIAFTVNPVTQNKNEIIIEAGFGLGEAIVAGEVTPDNYLVDKKEEMILEVNVNEQERMIIKTNENGVIKTDWVPVEESIRSKQKLTGSQVMELALICKKIEEHYGFPCDIEWAFNEKFYIVQSRPITTLS